jgi:tRNA threonylcarbamoyladenosine biosynthesis protein TsaB
MSKNFSAKISLFILNTITLSSLIDFFYKMACILHIETSVKIGSLVISDEGKIIFDRTSKENSSHASEMGVFAEEALRHIEKEGKKLDAVAVSEGPGSYTGLRIGVSLAKGICYGLDIPLIAIPTLQILANSMVSGKLQSEISGIKWFVPMLDARRMEVYSAIYDRNLEEVRPVEAEIIDEHSFGDRLSQGKILFFGDGSDKCKTIIKSPNAVFMDGIRPAAKNMVKLAEVFYTLKKTVDMAYFEPFYLKDFQATVPKSKVF